jgi:hypothetical protein
MMEPVQQTAMVVVPVRVVARIGFNSLVQEK